MSTVVLAARLRKELADRFAGHDIVVDELIRRLKSKGMNSTQVGSSRYLFSGRFPKLKSDWELYIKQATRGLRWEVELNRFGEIDLLNYSWDKEYYSAVRISPEKHDITVGLGRI